MSLDSGPASGADELAIDKKSLVTRKSSAPHSRGFVFSLVTSGHLLEAAHQLRSCHAQTRNWVAAQAAPERRQSHFWVSDLALSPAFCRNWPSFVPIGDLKSKSTATKGGGTKQTDKQTFEKDRPSTDTCRNHLLPCMDTPHSERQAARVDCGSAQAPQKGLQTLLLELSFGPKTRLHRRVEKPSNSTSGALF